VTISSVPFGAEVTVDGEPLPGLTPLHGLRLASGRRRVVVEGPAGRCATTVSISTARANTLICELASGTLTSRQ
jgi:hypothetical protein